MKFIVFTDGSCDNAIKEKPGGWAYIILDEDGKFVCQDSKGGFGTTNNRMELRAFYEALKKIPVASCVQFFSDSQYALGVLSGKWEAKSNLDIIERVRRMVREKHIFAEWWWVRGHAGYIWNEKADELADSAMVSAMREFMPKYTPTVIRRKNMKPEKRLIARTGDDLMRFKIPEKGPIVAGVGLAEEIFF